MFSPSWPWFPLACKRADLQYNRYLLYEHDRHNFLFFYVALAFGPVFKNDRLVFDCLVNSLEIRERAREFREEDDFKRVRSHSEFAEGLVFDLMVSFRLHYGGRYIQ